MNIIKTIAPLGCANGACPSLLLTDEGTVLVQGARLAANQRLTRWPSYSRLATKPFAQPTTNCAKR